MILKRKIYSKLLNWKNECKGTKAIMVEGARRIGKSTIVAFKRLHDIKVTITTYHIV